MSAPIGIYVRVSRKGDREDERFHSPKEQAERAASIVVARGLVPGPVFEDIDVSGATAPKDRPAMGELLAAVERGDLGGIAAFSLDRLSREPAHGDALVRRVTKAGGVLLTPDIPDAIDSPTGEFTFGMLLQVAKLYRSQSGARFASAKERATLAGIPVSNPPYGYRRGVDRRIELDPDLAPVVRDLFERRAAGANWGDLADRLGEATGKTHPKQTVSAMIANRLYATGRLEYGDVVSEHAAEPIVDEPLWHAAQLAWSGPRPKRNPESKWLLTGLARCGVCGHALKAWKGSAFRRRDPRRGKMERVPQKVSRRYVCQNRACPARDVGPKIGVDAPRLERFVTLQSFLVGDKLATRNDAPDLRGLEDALDVAERRLAQALAPEAQDALGDAWASTVKARRNDRDAAAAALGEARRDAGGASVDVRLREVWDGLSPADRREAIALFWKEVRVHRYNGTTTVTFVARGPHAEAEVQLPNDQKGVDQ